MYCFLQYFLNIVRGFYGNWKDIFCGSWKNYSWVTHIYLKKLVKFGIKIILEWWIDIFAWSWSGVSKISNVRLIRRNCCYFSPQTIIIYSYSSPVVERQFWCNIVMIVNLLNSRDLKNGYIQPQQSSRKQCAIVSFSPIFIFYWREMYSFQFQTETYILYLNFFISLWNIY